MRREAAAPGLRLALARMAAAASDPASQAAFLTRNAAQALPAGALDERLRKAAAEGRQLRVKLGLDPTAADIHLGHTVVLQKLREFQDLGHRVVLIVGDYTARVGDPSGRSDTRPVLSDEEIEANARTYERQAQKVLDEDPDRYELRFNGEWLDMRMPELFRLARTTTVAQLLDREDFATRYAAGAPISILELLYPLMQGYDSVAVRSDVELGGTDQTFNLLLGRDIQRHFGQPEQSVLTLPILPGTDGVDKMSKTKGNQVGITEPPEEMFGKTMRLPDEAMGEWFELLAVERPDGASPRDAKRRPGAGDHRPLPRRRSRRGRRAALRPRPRRAPGAGRDRRRHGERRRRPGPRPRRAGRGLRRLALGGPPPDRPGRRARRRRAARRRGARRPARAPRRRRRPARAAAFPAARAALSAAARRAGGDPPGLLVCRPRRVAPRKRPRYRGTNYGAILDDPLPALRRQPL